MLGGAYSPRYAYIMLDRSSGKVWADEFYDLGHGSWVKYDDSAIVNLSRIMGERDIEVNMTNVRDTAQQLISEYEEGNTDV